MSKDKAPPNWRSRLQEWAQKAENTLQDFRHSEAVERVSSAGRLASRQVTEMWKETSKVAEQVRASDAWQAIEIRAEKVRSNTQAMARETGQRFEKAQKDIEKLLATLDEAGRYPDERARVIHLATQAFELAGPYLDLLADAVAVGSVQEAGVGLASLQGTELYFVPPDGPVRAQLRVHRMVGQTARLAVGGQVGTYVAALYGSRDLLVRNMHRRGADLGLIALSLGFFRATAMESTLHHAGGWLVELAAGLSFGIPILSDMSTFELEEISLSIYSLENEESAAIEEAIAQAPDRSMRRAVARRLAGDPDGKAS
ncbi:MAG: hypothetical protein KTR25_02305 [Myxococcales bacterium]|nr:hypothetical protein [Myxococcales bacterium]